MGEGDLHAYVWLHAYTPIASLLQAGSLLHKSMLRGHSQRPRPDPDEERMHAACRGANAAHAPCIVVIAHAALPKLTTNLANPSLAGRATAPLQRDR